MIRWRWRPSGRGRWADRTADACLGGVVLCEVGGCECDVGVEFDPVVGAGFAYAAEEMAAVSEFEGCEVA